MKLNDDDDDDDDTPSFTHKLHSEQARINKLALHLLLLGCCFAMHSAVHP